MRNTLLICMLCGALFLFSCKKELSRRSNNTETLVKTATGDCMPITVAGTYSGGVPLVASDYIEVQVDYAASGAYQITTDTINGYYFKGQGIAEAGINTVRLKGYGTPSLNETDIFTVTLGSSTCEADVTVGGGASTPVAVFTLGGAPGSCTGAVLAGSYTAGTAMNAGNKVTLNISATSTGTYNISTVTVNGVYFSGSGTISSTGAGNIILTASGTPLLAAATTFPVTVGGNTCNFNVTVNPAATPASYALNCTGATTTGVFTSGTALSAGNTVTLQATSTGAGSYSITTLPVNGVTFTGSGSFPSAGNFPVILTATGNIPAASGSYNYVASGGSASCGFTIVYAAPTGICSTPNNTSTSNVIGVGGDTFTHVNGLGSGGIYDVEADATGEVLHLRFNGNTAPADGDYASSGGYFATGSSDVGVFYTVFPFDFVMLTGYTIHVTTVAGGKEMSFCSAHFDNPVSSTTLIISAKITVP